MRHQRSVSIVALAALIVVLASCEPREVLPDPGAGVAELARLTITVDPSAENPVVQARLERAGLQTDNNVNDLVRLENLTTSLDGTPAPNAPAGVFTISATFTNASSDPLLAPFFEVTALTGGNLLLNADGGPGGVGSQMTVPLTTLAPGESFIVDFQIGLQTAAPFDFLVDVFADTPGAQ